MWSLAGEYFPLPELVHSFAFNTAAKAIIWLAPFLFAFRKRDGRWLVSPRLGFTSPFPWAPFFAGVCLIVAFLHTMHILLLGIDVWGMFQPIWIFTALAAAVIEELAFRGYLFNRQAAVIGAFKAAIINGFLFAFYHFPELIIARNLLAVLSLRFWVIVVMGLIFSMAFAKWKNLLMTMLIHFTWNMLCYWFALS